MTKMDKKIEEKFHSPYDSSLRSQCMKAQLDKRSFWMQTPLNEFGFKCIANKHEFCSYSKCGCFCH